MKIYELQNFCEVCKSKSFTKAAQNLYMSRQSVLRSINSLESELRHPLFSRGPLGVTLTEFGEMFYEKVGLILNDIDALNTLAEEYDRKKNQRIGIGIRGNFRSAFIVRTLVKEFQLLNPDVEVEIIGCETDDIVPDVRDGRIDFGFTIVSDAYSDLDTIPLETLEFVLLTYKGSALTANETIHADDLSGEQLISAAFSRHPAMMVSGFSNARGEGPEILMDTMDLGFLYHMVHNKSAHGILIYRDAQIATKLFDDVVCRRFDPAVCLQLGLVFRKEIEMRPLMQNFIDYAANNYDRIRKQNKLDIDI